MNNIVYIKHRSGHHSNHSGYSKLIDYMPGDFVPRTKPFIPYRIRKMVSSRTAQNAGIYTVVSVHKEASLVAQMIRKRRGIAHFLNGERDIRFLIFLKSLFGWRFVATFHKPPDILGKNITDYSYLSRLDGAIAVGQNQVDFLKEKLGVENVSFIPHGVDTEFFTPSKGPWNKHTCLFVGQHLRDFETLDACVLKIQKHLPDFRLKAVLKEDAAHALPKSPAVEVYSKISDEELLELYRSSAALLLPLTDTTACNSILEALACGLPIITNAVGGIDSYINKDSGFLLKKGDSHSMAKIAIYLMENESENAEMRINCRAQSLKFSWGNVAREISDFYKKLD